MLPKTLEGVRGPHWRGRQQSPWPRSKYSRLPSMKPMVLVCRHIIIILHATGRLSGIRKFICFYRRMRTRTNQLVLHTGVALGSVMSLCMAVLYVTHRTLLDHPSGPPTPAASHATRSSPTPKAIVVGGSAAYQADLTLLHRLLPLTNFSALTSADILDPQAGILQHSQLQQLMQLQQNLYCS